jgi:serine/threonine protein kinase/tetratricopeptide (TPR) repeat protein/TolB-like protein
MGVECPKCQFENPEDTAYCGKCGTKFGSSEDVSPAYTETLETPKEKLTTGTTFAERFQIIEELGQGGMGKVYRALDKKLNEEVALKLIKPEIASDKKVIERFRNELKIARKIAHKNVGRMYELMEDEGAHYITMEYVPGEDLKSFIRRSGQLAVGTSIRITQQVAEGLAEAHRLRVVHRDLKPSNVMIDKEGNARIMDFGIARSLRAEGLTREGVAVGTPAYMSPEQARGEDMDHRTDIWSLGVVLYEMLTGQLPFEGKNEQALIHSILNDDPKPLTGLRPEAAQELGRIVEKALAKSPETRYANINEMLADIRSFEKEHETKEVTPKAPLLKDLWRRRVPQILGIYLIAVKLIEEFVNWLGGRFALSPNLPDFILAVLLSMIPTVLILAYVHRRSGRAKWIKAEKIVIPVNLLISAALLFFLFYGRDLGAATKKVIYIDEEGLTIERTIPKSEFRKKVALTYFDNETGDPELDWLQYGIVMALRIDLVQDLYLNVGAGFDSKLKEAGFNEGVGVPLTLKREIAQDRHLDYFVSGSFTEDNEGFTVNTSLYETRRMKLLRERSFTGKDIFELTDEMSVQLKHDLEIPAHHIGETEDKPVSEMMTDSLSAFKLFVIGNYMSEIKADWAKASDYLKQAVDDDPTFAYAWFALSMAYLQLNQGEKAEEAIRSAMQHDYKISEKDKFQGKYIYYYLHKMDQEMVFSLAKRRVELFPEDIEGHEWLASIYAGKNQLDEALSEYELILDLDPEQYRILQEIAYIYESKGEFEKALDFYKQYANQFPDNPESFAAIGALYKNLGDHEQAKAYYKKAILIEPENIQILITLADIESNLGNFEQALEQYHEALELCKTPNQRSQVFMSFRQYYEMRGQLNKALDYIQQAKVEGEKFQTPVQHLVDDVDYIATYIDAGKQSLAFEAIKKIEGRPIPFLEKVLPFGYMQIYLALEDADNAEKMIDGLEIFIKTWGIESFRFFVFFAQGRINEIRGEYEQAILDYQKSLELAPTELMTLEGMGRCYRKLKVYEKAEKSLQDALKIRPFNPKFNYEIALVYWDWGKEEKALEHLERALYVWENADPEYKPAQKARDKLAEWNKKK